MWINKKIMDNRNSIYMMLLTVISVIFYIVINMINKSNDIKLFNMAVIVYILCTLITSLIYQYLLRLEIINFSDRLCNLVDNIISKEEIEFQIYNETITSKVENKLKQLVEIIQNEREIYVTEKNEVKSLISDISHQIKTPISNISIYNETLINRKLNESQIKLCLNNMEFQINKLDWLVKCLIKMSRLESNMITLNKSKNNVLSIINRVINTIDMKASDKDISINFDMNEDIFINCDSKWTEEAIFNIIENSIKYSDRESNININIEQLDMFTKIEIKDFGIGIAENEINNIFKRFYRSSDVSEKEGVGIGLYLSRKIIQMQGGYIKVKSKKGVGSSFYIYLLN